MPYSNYTESLLDLKDVIVTNIKAEENVRTIYLEQKRTPHICPSCGTQTDHVHDYRVQPVKIFPPLGSIPFSFLERGAIPVPVAVSASLSR